MSELDLLGKELKSAQKRLDISELEKERAAKALGSIVSPSKDASPSKRSTLSSPSHIAGTPVSPEKLSEAAQRAFVGGKTKTVMRNGRPVTLIEVEVSETESEDFGLPPPPPPPQWEKRIIDEKRRMSSG